MNLISFSLYGADPKYCVGAVRNVELAREFYPDFFPVFYIDRTVPLDCVGALRKRGAIIREPELTMSPDPRFWRFYAARESGIILFRDTDSRINVREAGAVKVWIDSGKKIHVMRDHPQHCAQIMAGMWGVRDHALNNIDTLIEKWSRNAGQVLIGSDQDFLTASVYSRFTESMLRHDTFTAHERPTGHEFPTTEYEGFVGEVFDEYDQHREADRVIFKGYPR